MESLVYEYIPPQFSFSLSPLYWIYWNRQKQSRKYLVSLLLSSRINGFISEISQHLISTVHTNSQKN